MSRETQAESFIKILSEILEAERKRQKKRVRLQQSESNPHYAVEHRKEFENGGRSLE